MANLAPRLTRWRRDHAGLPGVQPLSQQPPVVRDPFPAGPLDSVTQVRLGTSWVEITPYVYSRDRVRVTRGRSAEGTQTDRSSCGLTLDNRDGRFSPRNPTGPWHGILGRYTPLRHAVRREWSWLDLPVSADGGDYVQAADSPNLSVVGDIDIRLDISLDTWWTYVEKILIDKSGNDSLTQYSWALWTSNPIVPTLTVGHLRFEWSTDGTPAGMVEAEATAPVPLVGRNTARVTLDVDNGAAGWTCTFYTGPSVDGPWTQLGEPVTGAGVTSIFDSTSPARIRPLIRAEAHAAKILAGIGGTEVANPDFTASADGDTSVQDAAGNTWTCQGAAAMSRKHWRFCGEVPAWPVRWAAAGADIWTPVTAVGQLQRIGSANTPLKSAMTRGVLARSNLVAYWPAEDGSDSARIASATGSQPMNVTGSPSYAAATVTAGSDPLPTLNSSVWTGTVPAYTGTGEIELRFLLQVPAAGAVTGAVLARLACTGTAPRWDLSYTTAGTGSLRLQAFDSTGVSLADSGAVDCALNGADAYVLLRLDQTGADVHWEFYAAVGVAAYGTTGNLVGNTVSQATVVRINPSANLTDTALGQISVESAVTTGIVSQELSNQTLGWVGEPAAARVTRLCTEEGVQVRELGFADRATLAAISLTWSSNPSSPMGVQRPAALVTLLRECADTDQGILLEPRDQLGLAYLPREALYNRPVGAALDYAASHLVGMEPQADDQGVTNDVTVSRTGGSSARAVADDGRTLNINDPDDTPPGIGRVESAATVNTETDAVLGDHAGLRLRLGTVDVERYPLIEVNLARPALVADPAVSQALLTADTGSRVTVDNPPDLLPPGVVDQAVQGLTETMWQYEHSIGLGCTPAEGWSAGVYEADADRYSSDGSTLAVEAPPGATSLTVLTPTGPVWADTDGDFDILVSGERLTVTAVTGAATPQTFTATRGVNGVSKTLPAGSAVELFQPAYYAL